MAALDNGFAMPEADVIQKHHDMHYNKQFIQNTVENFFFSEADDEPTTTRQGFAWGTLCPLELVSGVKKCMSFKNKCNSCTSMIDDIHARNYLAKHAWTSTNHPTCNDVDASFDAANLCNIEEFEETPEDRAQYRKMVIQAAETAVNAEPVKDEVEEPAAASTHRSSRKRRDDDSSRRRRGDDDSSKRRRRRGSKEETDAPVHQLRGSRAAEAAVPEASGAAADDDDESATQEQDAPTLNSQERAARRQVEDVWQSRRKPPAVSPVAAAPAAARPDVGMSVRDIRPGQVAKASRPKTGVTVSLEDLVTLRTNLDRQLESQSRMVSGMQFFLRQFEDEKQITQDTRDVVQRLVIKARLVAGMTVDEESA